MYDMEFPITLNQFNIEYLGGELKTDRFNFLLYTYLNICENIQPSHVEHA
jgi:hypothetical protein